MKGTLCIVVVLVAIGLNVNHVSGSCCHKVKTEFSVKNNAYGQRSDYFGYYTMQAGFVNGKPHFLKEDGKKAIWSSPKGSQWLVGKKSDLGKHSGVFYVKSKADCPYTPSYSWKYV